MFLEAVGGCKDNMSTILHKVSNKYRALPAPVKASIWFTVCNIVQKGIALLTTPLFTRLLTVEQYGVYTLYQSWYQIITIFATLNLYAGVFNNGMVKYKDEKDKFTSVMQGLSTTFTIGLFIIYLCAIPFWNELLGLNTLYIAAMFVELLFVPAYNFWMVRQRFDYKYKKIIITTAIIAFGSPILGVLAVVSTSYKAEARVLSYVFVQVAVGFVFYLFNAMRGRKFFDKKIWKFALAFNLPLIPHYLSYTMLSQADRVMISKMCGNDFAAIYGVAYAISMMMTVFTNAINSSFIPYTYKELKKEKYDGVRDIANLLLLLIASLSIIAMAFSPEIIMLFATEEYYDAIWVMPPLAASVFFTFLYPLFGNIEFYFEKTKYVTIASCTGAVTNIILNFIFIPIFGYYAAGYTTLVCYMLFSFAHYYFHRRVLKKQLPGVKNIYNIKFLVIVSIGVLAVMFVMIMTYTLFWVRYSIIMTVIVILLIKRKTIIAKLKLIKKK